MELALRVRRSCLRVLELQDLTESLLSLGKSDTHVCRNSGRGTDESLIQFTMTRYADRLAYNTPKLPGNRLRSTLTSQTPHRG